MIYLLKEMRWDTSGLPILKIYMSQRPFNVCFKQNASGGHGPNEWNWEIVL